MRLIHKARNIGCFTLSPQATRRSGGLPEFNSTLIHISGRVILPNYNYNAARTMPINVCCGISELLLQYHPPSDFIDYNRYHTLNNGYRALTPSDKHSGHISFRYVFYRFSSVIREELICRNISEKGVRTIHKARVYTSFLRPEQGVRLIYGCVLYMQNYDIGGVFVVSTVQTFNSCTSRPGVCQCLVVNHTWIIFLKN